MDLDKEERKIRQKSLHEPVKQADYRFVSNSGVSGVWLGPARTSRSRVSQILFIGQA
jgi:hypothetical protein